MSNGSKGQPVLTAVEGNMNGGGRSMSRHHRAGVTKSQLNRIARNGAHYAGLHSFPLRRGSLYFEDDKDLHVIFGNDGYRTDDRAKMEARTVRDAALARGLPTSEIQVDYEDGYSWAVAVVGSNDDAYELGQVASKTWRKETKKREAARKAKRN
jgi:hypothetical protein